MKMPLVDPKDDGLRDQRPGVCFYCDQAIGRPHLETCVCVSKRVRLRYTIEIEVDVPHCWDGDTINFHRNDGSWCAGNAIDDLVEAKAKLDQDGRCMCDRFTSELVEIVDPTPRAKVRV